MTRHTEVAGAGQVHEEPKNIEWVCAQIADCVWGCSWPPLDLTEEEISRIREGAQYLMTSLRPASAANTEGLREALAIELFKQSVDFEDEIVIPTERCRRLFIGMSQSDRNEWFVKVDRLLAIASAGTEGPGLGSEERFICHMICCGLDDGYIAFATWDDADKFRESYTSGVAVAKHGYSAAPDESGHKRAVIVSQGPWSDPLGVWRSALAGRPVEGEKK